MGITKRKFLGILGGAAVIPFTGLAASAALEPTKLAKLTHAPYLAITPEMAQKLRDNIAKHNPLYWRLKNAAKEIHVKESL